MELLCRTGERTIRPTPHGELNNGPPHLRSDGHPPLLWLHHAVVRLHQQHKTRDSDRLRVHPQFHGFGSSRACEHPAE
jgi:hypothetical protein